MPRIAQKPARAGSQKWLQLLVERDPSVLDPAGWQGLDWISPRASDDYAEYQDAAFLDALRLGQLKTGLSGFWPNRGPVWDGLARSGDAVFLVEAKSHVPEFLSSPCAASSPVSRTMIGKALDRTRQALVADDRADWSRSFFQYANRLAHLWWLTEQGVDAHLLLVSFIGDHAQSGPADPETWQAAFRCADYAMGLPTKHALSRRIHHVHPDVSRL